MDALLPAPRDFVKVACHMLGADMMEHAIHRATNPVVEALGGVGVNDTADIFGGAMIDGVEPVAKSTIAPDNPCRPAEKRWIRPLRP